ncbi:MAG: FtsB family cell division protein [Anaerolineae bacterium]
MRNGRQRLPIPPTDIMTMLAVIVAIFFILAFGGKAVEGYRVQRHNDMLREEIAALQKEQEKLKARLEYVQTPEYVEEVARKEYKWVKAGENPIIPIFRHRPVVFIAPTPAPQPESSTASPLSHWPDWLHLLKGTR